MKRITAALVMALLVLVMMPTMTWAVNEVDATTSYHETIDELYFFDLNLSKEESGFSSTETFLKQMAINSAYKLSGESAYEPLGERWARFGMDVANRSVGTYPVVNELDTPICTYGTSIASVQTELGDKFYKNAVVSGRGTKGESSWDSLVISFAVPGTFENADIAKLTDTQPVVGVLLSGSEKRNNIMFSYDGVVAYLYNIKVSPVITQNILADDNPDVSVSYDTSGSTKYYSSGIKNLTPNSATANQSVSKSLTETLSNTVNHSSSYSFSEGIKIGPEFPLNKIAPYKTLDFEVSFSAEQAFSNGWSKTDSLSNTTSQSSSVGVTLPPYSQLQILQSIVDASSTTTYSQPVYISYDVILVYYNIAEATTLKPTQKMASFAGDTYRGSSDARSDLKVRSTDSLITDPDGISYTSLDSATLKGITDNIPMSKAGGVMSYNLTGVASEISSVIASYPLDSVVLSKGSRTQSLDVGDTQSLDGLTVSGKNKFDSDYFGFDDTSGHWEVVDSSGNSAGTNNGVIELTTNAMTGENTVHALSAGTAYLKYVINEDCYKAADQAGYTKNSDLSSTAVIEYDVVAAPFDGTVTASGSASAVIGGNPLDLSDSASGITATVYDATGKEISPAASVTWEAQEASVKGISIASGRYVTVTKEGTFHVRATYRDKTSDWVEIVARNSSTLTSVELADETTPATLAAITFDETGTQAVDLSKLSVNAIDQYGTTMDPATLGTVTWTANGTALPSSILTIPAAGTYTITARAAGMTSNALTLTVAKPTFDGTVEAKGAVTVVVDDTPAVDLNNIGSGVSVAAYGADGVEVSPVTFTWESREAASRGIKIANGHELTTTMAGTFHVRAWYHDKVSDWIEVTSVASPYLSSVSLADTTTPAVLADRVLATTSLTVDLSRLGITFYDQYGNVMYANAATLPSFTWYVNSQALSGSYLDISSTGTYAISLRCEGVDSNALTLNVSKSTTPVTRLQGNGALDTMKAIENEAFASADVAIIATNSTYQDALTASSLAGLENAPVLLTEPDTLSVQTSQELTRLGVKGVYIIGGTAAVSTDVESAIQDLGISTARIAGDNAVETANAIYEQGKGKWGSTAVVTTSTAFQDALSYAPYAYAENSPIFLCNGDHVLNATTLADIKAGGFDRVLILGGNAAVATSVRDQLGSDLYGGRLAGADCYDTSREIALWEISQGMDANQLAVATASTFQDALTGAAMCGKNESVLVLADVGHETCIDRVIAPNSGSILSAYILGGTAAVPDTVADDLAAALA